MKTSLRGEDPIPEGGVAWDRGPVQGWSWGTDGCAASGGSWVVGKMPEALNPDRTGTLSTEGFR